jgi:hypothetical protein
VPGKTAEATMRHARELTILGVALACAAGLFAYDRSELRRQRQEAQELEREGEPVRTVDPTIRVRQEN